MSEGKPEIDRVYGDMEKAIRRWAEEAHARHVRFGLDDDEARNKVACAARGLVVSLALDAVPGEDKDDVFSRLHGAHVTMTELHLTATDVITLTSVADDALVKAEAEYHRWQDIFEDIEMGLAIKAGRR